MLRRTRCDRAEKAASGAVTVSVLWARATGADGKPVVWRSQKLLGFGF